MSSTSVVAASVAASVLDTTVAALPEVHSSDKEVELPRDDSDSESDSESDSDSDSGSDSDGDSNSDSDNYDDYHTYDDVSDTCPGCYWCDPAAYAEKPPVEPFPKGHVLLIRCVCHSWECDYDDEMWTRVFSSYESASKAILDEFKDGCYSIGYSYDDPNYAKYERKIPTLEWACWNYNPVALSNLGTSIDGAYRLRGKYGTRYCIRSEVLHMQLLKIE